MNLSQLYYFRKLAELQHYAKAAKELYITQPSLSNAISSLEQELGVSLFQKTGRNIHLTKYGAEFLAYVNKGLEQIDKGIAIMKNYAGTGDGGKIDLGCIITVQTDFIPKLLNGYKAAAGGVAFNVREDTSIPLVKDLLSSCYDVVFCAKGNEDPDLAYVPVLTQKVVVAMSSDCPLVEKEFVTPTDLLEQHLITYVDTIPLGRAVRRMLDECGIKNVEYSYLDESILAGFAANGVEAAVIELPYAPAPDPAACGGFLERLPAASAADCADSIELSYDVVGGFDANALRVFWKVREAGCEPRWFALKAFTGMQLKYVLPGKRAPIVFALGDEDAYAYCDEDPCVGCTFRCKRGFELYAYVEKIGLVAQSVHREAVTR